MFFSFSLFWEVPHSFQDLSYKGQSGQIWPITGPCFMFLVFSVCHKYGSLLLRNLIAPSSTLSNGNHKPKDFLIILMTSLITSLILNLSMIWNYGISSLCPLVKTRPLVSLCWPHNIFRPMRAQAGEKEHLLCHVSILPKLDRLPLLPWNILKQKEPSQ